MFLIIWGFVSESCTWYAQDCAGYNNENMKYSPNATRELDIPFVLWPNPTYCGNFAGRRKQGDELCRDWTFFRVVALAQREVTDQTLPGEALLSFMLQSIFISMKKAYQFLLSSSSQKTAYETTHNNDRCRDLPGGPVVKTPRCQCQGRGFHPWWENW